jgi:hypothetical protein
VLEVGRGDDSGLVLGSPQAFFKGVAQQVVIGKKPKNLKQTFFDMCHIIILHNFINI